MNVKKYLPVWIDGVINWFSRDDLKKEINGLRKMITGFQSDFMLQGQSTEHPEDTQANTLAERSDANIAIAIRVKSNAISWIPIKVQEITVEDGQRVYEDNIEHPALDIIREPNPFITKAQLMSHFSASLDLTGNAFCEIRKQGDNVTLWPVQTYRVEIEYNKEKNEVIEYIIDKNNKDTEKHLKPDEMLHLRYYNINDPLHGLSYIKPIERQILMDYYVEIFNKAFFKHGCTVSAIYNPGPGNQFSFDQAKQIVTAFSSAHAGAENAHKLFVPQHGGELKETGQSHKDLQFDTLLKRNREKIFGVLGIPPSVAGIYEYANYANAKIQEETFWRHTMIPQLNIISDGLNNQIINKFYPEDNIIYKFDLSGVDALQGDRLKEAQRLSILGQYYMPINRVLEALGQDPLEYPWAELPAKFALSEVGGINDEGATAQRGYALLPRAVKSPKYWKWKRYDDFLSSKENKYKRLIKVYFKDQSERVIEAIEKATSKGLWMHDWYHKMFRKDDEGLDPKLANQIFDVNVENVYLANMIEPYLKDVIMDSGDRVFGEYNIDLIFNVNSPEVETTISQLVNRSQKINNTTYQGIKNILTDAYKEGWSMGQLAGQIRSEYKQFGIVRSERIARTEMLTAVNGGTELAYGQAGIEKKEWLASLDMATRDTHVDLDGEVVRVGQPFTRGSYPMMYPGDPHAPAREVCNCRCALIANFEE